MAERRQTLHPPPKSEARWRAKRKDVSNTLTSRCQKVSDVLNVSHIQATHFPAHFRKISRALGNIWSMIDAL